MLRQCITFLRTHGFSMFLPLDQHIYFHKLTGVFIFGLSVLHTIMHLSNFSLVVVNDPTMGNYTLTEWLLTDRPGKFGLVPGVANPTGIALIIILVIMFICSQPFFRHGGSFELTRSLPDILLDTHLLYIPFWILVILHGPNFWKWFIGPGILYLIERLVRFVSMRSERGKTYISSDLLLPSRVTHLVIKRPHHFDYHAGDYVFVNVPAIAKYEWHPFTISSAPEQEDYIWLHIRGVGEWTNRMYNYFEREHERLHSVEDQLLGNMINRPMRKFTDRDSTTSTRSKAVDFMKHADSPRTGYLNESTSSDSDFNLNSSMPHHSDSDISGPHAGNADLPGWSIWCALQSHIPSATCCADCHWHRVTPFASILQSIMLRYWKARHSCPKCKFSWASDIPATVMNLRKVDFFWINRDQRSFEWFVNLLSQLEIEQAELGGAMERFLEMHMYITSALQKTDMKAVGLQLALDLLHEKEKRDLITGLKTRTNAGRPNWDKVFKQLADQKKGKVTVFYCGPPQLGRILRVKCDQFNFSFRKEVF
ncbi:NADPH oxidase 5 [Blattella germanica]|nr:NADPH oxidase 5 [Blattella germanica]